MFSNKIQLTYSNHKGYFFIHIGLCREHKMFKPTRDKPLPLLTFSVGWFFFPPSLLASLVKLQIIKVFISSLL